MRVFSKVAFMAVMCLAVMSRCLAGPRFGGGWQEGRSTFERVVEGVGGTAFTVAGAGLASSGVAALGGAIASASTSLAMGGTAAGFLGAVGMGAGIVALGAGVALVGIHYITDATGVWTFEDSRKLFDKGCKKLADRLIGKKSATDFDDAGLMPASMIDPLPELDSMQEFISRTENGSAHSVKVMDAETLKRIDPEAYEAMSGASGASASESSSERVKKMREKRKELRERLAAMDVDDGSQDWCKINFSKVDNDGRDVKIPDLSKLISILKQMIEYLRRINAMGHKPSAEDFVGYNNLVGDAREEFKKILMAIAVDAEQKNIPEEEQFRVGNELSKLMAAKIEPYTKTLEELQDQIKAKDWGRFDGIEFGSLINIK